MRKYSHAGKALIAIFEDIHTVLSGGPSEVDVIGNATSPYHLDRYPVDHGRIGRKRAMNFKGSDLMASTVPNVQKLLLRVFGIFRGDLEGNALFLLGHRIA